MTLGDALLVAGAWSLALGLIVQLVFEDRYGPTVKGAFPSAFFGALAIVL